MVLLLLLLLLLLLVVLLAMLLAISGPGKAGGISRRLINNKRPVGVPKMLPNAKLFHHPRKVNADQLWLTARRDRPVSTRVSTFFCKRI